MSFFAKIKLRVTSVANGGRSRCLTFPASLVWLLTRSTCVRCTYSTDQTTPDLNFPSWKLLQDDWLITVKSVLIHPVRLTDRAWRLYVRVNNHCWCTLAHISNFQFLLLTFRIINELINPLDI